MSSQTSPPQSPKSLTNAPVVNVINSTHPRLPLASRAGSPAPSRLLGSGSRKSRLPCIHRRRRRCRCCCGWCSELRGSESRLRPFPAAAMKWMFKEDHSLGKRSATGRAVGAGAAGGPFPHSGRLGWAGRGGCRALGSGRRGPGSPDSCPQSPCRLPQALPGAKGSKTEAAGTPERGPGACVGRGGRKAGCPGTGLRAGTTVSRCVSPTEHRCVESAKIRAKYPDRVPVSGLPAPSPHCHPCRLGPVTGHQAIQQLTS